MARTIFTEIGFSCVDKFTIDESLYPMVFKLSKIVIEQFESFFRSNTTLCVKNEPRALRHFNACIASNL